MSPAIEEHWNSWFKVHQVKLSTFGCIEAVAAGQDVDVLQRYHITRWLKGRRRVASEVYKLKMELGEHRRNILLRVDKMVKDLSGGVSSIDPQNVDIVIFR